MIRRTCGTTKMRALRQTRPAVPAIMLASRNTVSRAADEGTSLWRGVVYAKRGRPPSDTNSLQPCATAHPAPTDGRPPVAALMAALTTTGFMLASYTATPPRPCRATIRSNVVASALTELPRSAGSAASRKRSATISARCCNSTCSANRSARTSLHAATTTTSVTPLTSSAINLKLRVMSRRRGGRHRPAPLASTRRPDALGEHPDDDAPVLRATFFGLVGRHRLLAPVADDVHLVQRNLMLLEEITLHDLGALH